jgi:molybdopterin-binding protein
MRRNFLKKCVDKVIEGKNEGNMEIIIAGIISILAATAAAKAAPVMKPVPVKKKK